MPINKLIDPFKDITTFISQGEISFDEILQAMIMFYQGIDDPPTKRVLW